MPNDFASTLIALRGEKNLTQQQLGDAAGVSPSQISRYEAGIAEPRKTVLLKLAKALDVELSQLRPPRRFRVSVGESVEPADNGKLFRQAIEQVEQLDAAHMESVRKQALDAGLPFEDYFRQTSEKGFLDLIQKSVNEGDIADALLLRSVARVVFGTNIKLEPEA